jgi:integrase
MKQMARHQNTISFTPRFVRAVQPQAERVRYKDAKMEHLRLIVEPSGRKSFYFFYTQHGRPRWFRLGPVGTVDLGTARNVARELWAKRILDPTYDPQAERKRGHKVTTFAELVKRYIEEEAKPNNKSWRQNQRKTEAYLIPRWGDRPANSITRKDVNELRQQLTNDGKLTMSNHAVVQASAIFSWALREVVGDVTINPAQNVKANKTRSRERVLRDHEYPLYWQGFEHAGYVGCHALRMLLLTGQRPQEIQYTRWADIEEHEDGAWWHLPGEEDDGWPGVKNGRSHRAWLAEPTMSILEEMRGHDDVHVFARVDRLHIAMRKVNAKLDVDDPVRPHDLRRSFCTLVTSLGHSRAVMHRLSNHASGDAVGDIYDRASYADADKAVHAEVSARIMSLSGVNVIAITA